MSTTCHPTAVTLLPGALTGAEGSNALLIHFKANRAPNSGNPFWIELGALGFIRLKLVVVIGDQATYAVETWRRANESVPPEELLLSAFLDLPRGGPELA